MRPLILWFLLSLDLGVINVRLEGRSSWPATQEQNDDGLPWANPL